MDEIETRLKQASDNCIKHYEAWRKEKKNGEAIEALREAIHELRKVGARLEIEMAVSERDELGAKPIPIPPHRSSKRQTGPKGGGNHPGKGGKDKRDGNDGPKKVSARRKTGSDKQD
jgi:hypothetical protein